MVWSDQGALEDESASSDEDDGAIMGSSDDEDIAISDEDEGAIIGSSDDDDETTTSDDEELTTASLDDETTLTGVVVGVPRLKMKIRPTITITATMMIIHVLRFIAKPLGLEERVDWEKVSSSA